MDTITLAAILSVGIVVVVGGSVVYWLVARKKRWVVIIDDRGEHHRVPLPPHFLPRNHIQEIKTVFRTDTTATFDELLPYIHRSLPDAGWTFADAYSTLLGEIIFDFYRNDNHLRVVTKPSVDILSREPWEGQPVRRRKDKRSPRIQRKRKPISGQKVTITIFANDKPTSLRQEVMDIRALGKPGNSAAVEPLIELLSHRRPKVRTTAIISLMKIGDERAIQPLIDKLNDNDADVRLTAAMALGEFGGKQAAKALVAALDTDDHDFQITCAKVLARMRCDFDALMGLIAHLTSYESDSRLRIAAGWILGEIPRTLEATFGVQVGIPLEASSALGDCALDANNEDFVRVMAFKAYAKNRGTEDVSVLHRKLPLRLRQQLPLNPEPSRFGDSLADKIAEDTAEFIVFDILGFGK